ncbi:MAG: VIT and VWA domain-containing protein [Calditrichaceae bacterium]
MSDLWGLLSKENQSVPLMGVTVNGELLGRGAKLIIRQKFRNNEKRAIEAVYKFPLPESSAISGFRVWIGERLIDGKIEEREKAFEKYDDSLMAGDGAYLLDEERPNIFTLSVGNLNPGMEVTVEIELVMLLDTEGLNYRLTLPTTIAPRYIPGHMQHDQGIPIQSLVNPPYVPEVPYGLSMMLRIHHNGKLASVESISHPIRIKLHEKHVGVEFVSDSVAMDRDFILVIDPGESESGAAYFCKDGSYSYWQLDFATHQNGFAAETGSNEVIFLLDCSGSMSGDSIREAKKALEICLKALPPTCKFNVYRFGSSFNSFFVKSQDYSEYNLTSALDKLAKTEAILGGTEIFNPLREIYDTSPAKDRRTIVIITDGEVGNEQEIIDLAASNCSHTKVFSIGIGTGPNEHLIKGVARAGDGGAEFVYPGERIEPKVLRIFNRITSPGLEIESISWDGEDSEQAPATPTIFADAVSTIFTRRSSTDSIPSRIIVSGRAGAVMKEWHFDVTEIAPENMPLPQLWARERIRDLEETELRSGSQQQKRKLLKSNDMVIELSKEYGILSKFTSYLGIEKRKRSEKTSGEVKLRIIPTPITTGWHNHAKHTHVFSYKKHVYKDMESLNLDETRDFYKIRNMKQEIFTNQISLSRLYDKNIGTTDVLMSLLATQQSGGGFRITEDLARVLKLDLNKIQKLSASIKTAQTVDLFTLLSTVVIFEILRTRFVGQSNMWYAVTEKSRKWLDDVYGNDIPLLNGHELPVWGKTYVTDNLKADLFNDPDEF